ncbi:hypothetical protein AAULH_05354 [Lactobacillus helveticus MTCC 5463]|nr:hypothetical protein AAULH_05354 [Lactobacillus helveticus MTCC 5463]
MLSLPLPAPSANSPKAAELVSFSIETDNPKRFSNSSTILKLWMYGRALVPPMIPVF